MNSLTSQPWFWPTAAVVIALPITLLVLTELLQWLLRRGSSYARPILLLRNGVLPALGLLILVDQLNDADVEATWPRIAATVFGFLLILFALSGANAALFGQARAGSWRERLPRHQSEDSTTDSRRIATALGLDVQTVDAMLANSRRLIYSEGETVQAVGSVPEGIGFITEGELALTVSTDDGQESTVGQLDVGNYIGATALTRQPVLTGAIALRDTTLIMIPRDTIAAVVQGNPQLARLLGETIEHRRRAAEGWRTATTS